MQISHTASGGLRVLLSDGDLSRFGTDFAALREGDPQTNTVIRRILRAVFEKETLPYKTALTVEAVPTDGGCLLLITPQVNASDNVYTVAVATDNDLLQLQDALRTRITDGVVSTVFCRTETAFYAVIYCEALRNDLSAVLHEFGCVHTGSIHAARVLEFSEPVYDFG